MAKRTSKSSSSSSQVLPILIIVVISFLITSYLTSKKSPVNPIEKSIPSVEVQAKLDLIDRTNPDWLKDYCFQQIKQVASIPVSYERSRGPMHTFEPIFSADRHLSVKAAETCTLDYYYYPVATEAFAELNIPYAYSATVWDQFNQAVSASVSASLTDDGWKPITASGVKNEPDLMFTRFNSDEKITEYLDVFYTKDEEVIFELLVTSK